MKRYPIFIFIIPLFMACGQKKNELELFNNIMFQLSEGEKQTNLDALFVNAYDAYMKDRSFQIPLFRLVTNKEYAIYIGMPYNTSIEDICQQPLTVCDSLVVEKDAASCFRRYVCGQDHVVEYTAEKEGSLIYILATTKSETIVDDLFNKTSLSARLVQKK